MTSTPFGRSPRSSPASASAANGAASTGASVSATRVAALLVLTGLVTLGLGAVDPLATLQAWLTGGGATQRTQPARRDPAAWETSFGEDLHATLLAHRALPAGARRLLFLGNSQQYTCSLPRGAKAREHPARLASDLFGQRVNSLVPGTVAVYNASAPNQTFVEALWQAIYWFRVESWMAQQRLESGPHSRLPVRVKA